MRLTSWLEKGLDWPSLDELAALQTRMKSMVDKNIKLVNVIQVMLFRRILPCQSRTCNLWEFGPAKHQTLQQFFGATHEGIWKVLFKANEMWPKTTDDRGYNLTHPAIPVSFLCSKVFLHPYIQGRCLSFPICLFRAGQRRRSGSRVRLRCPKTQQSHF